MKLGFGRKRNNKPVEEAATPPAQEVPSQPPQLVVSAVSMLGGRTTQQDALDYRLLPNGAFAAAVCDGMGGLNGGEQASKAACSGFFQAYAQTNADTVPDLKQIARRLDRKITALKDTDGRPLDGGSTIVAAIINGDRFHWLSVGDSRIGLVRDGTFRWLNRLHNYQLELDEAFRAGELSREEYRAELPKGRALLSYLGCGGLNYIDTQQNLPWTPGDRLLLCSDGFSELLSQQELLTLLLNLDGGTADLTRALLPYMQAKGTLADNASAIVIQYSDKEREP